jgi:hypothetical protein
MKLKVPFKLGKFQYERELKFVFKIASLEFATNDVLGCDLWGVAEKNPADVNVAIIYGAYIQACREDSDKHWYQFKQKAIYNTSDAVYWVNHWSKDTEKQFVAACIELTGKLGKSTEEKKK